MSKLYEIINPSDPYTIRADSFQIAAAATLILGKGAFGLQSAEGDERLPVFLLGGADEFIRENYGNFQEWIDANLLEVAECLDTVMSFGLSERLAFDEAIELLEGEAKKQYRAKVHDMNRTSTSDIGSRAWALAEVFRGTDEIY